MSTPTLSITPLPFSSIPLTSSPDLAAWKSTLSVSAASLIASLATPSIWSTGKTYHGTQTLKALPGTPPGGGDTGGLKWHARVSKHSPKEGAWDEWKRELMQDHSVHEQQYVESCKEAKKVAVIEEGVLEVWQMSYQTPFPTSNRDFLVLLLTLDISPSPAPEATTPPGPRKFQVMSLPVEHPDAPARKGFVRGRYVAVEEVEEAEDGGVTWRMATASSAEGSIPKAITDMAMPGTIAEDVPSFVNWLAKFEKN